MFKPLHKALQWITLNPNHPSHEPSAQWGNSYTLTRKDFMTMLEQAPTIPVVPSHTAQSN